MTACFDADLLVIGGGPAGLMAAERARAAGFDVLLLERMGSCGRKFLIAGKGGLNLTHAEAKSAFVQRYSDGKAEVARWLDRFDAEQLRHFARGLGIETMVGSSGRVFPADLKAAPMMRAWLKRLRAQGVRFCYHARCIAIARDADGLRVQINQLDTDPPTYSLRARAVVLATGGGSWAKLGSDGAWADMLAALGVQLEPLQASNCGYETVWSDTLKLRAGEPIKPVIARVQDGQSQKGELMLTTYGLEGSLLYALSADIRRALLAQGFAKLSLDLAPDIALADLARKLAAARAGLTLSERLKRCAHLAPVKIALFYEGLSSGERAAISNSPEQIAVRVKALAVTLRSARPIDEAISTAGGVALQELNEALMLKRVPGLFCAGEMLAWDAPTGGYLLTASFASGFIAGDGVVQYLSQRA